MMRVSKMSPHSSSSALLAGDLFRHDDARQIRTVEGAVLEGGEGSTSRLIRRKCSVSYRIAWNMFENAACGNC